jgi:hypothetical protein
MAYDVRTRPGGFALAQARRRFQLAWLGTGVFLACAALVFALSVTDRGLALVASALFLVGTIALRPAAERYLDDQLHWAHGGAAERAVGETLDELRRDGWYLLHDVEALGGGNVDHIAAGPGGVFLIETKLRSYRNEQLGKVKRQAKLLHDELGGCWVTPVICLHRRKGNPFEHKDVWVVPHAHLLDWLRAQHNKTVPFETLARFAERL